MYHLTDFSQNFSCPQLGIVSPKPDYRLKSLFCALLELIINTATYIWWLIHIIFVNIHSLFAHNNIHCVKINGLIWLSSCLTSWNFNKCWQTFSHHTGHTKKGAWYLDCVYNFRIFCHLGNAKGVANCSGSPIPATSSNIQVHKYAIAWTHCHTDRG